MKSRIVLLLLVCSLFLWSVSIAAEGQKNADLVSCLDEAMYGYGTQKKGYCDRKSGNLIIKYQFEYADDFSEGLAAVINDEGNAYYIDMTGEKAFVTPEGVTDIAGFSEGLARIKMDGKYGYIDNKGEIVIEPQFEDAGAFFKDGVALVKELVNIKGTEFASRYGWIDKTGKVIIKPRFTYAQNFSDGLAMVSYIKGKKMIIGFIDKTGKEVVTLDEDTSMFMLYNRDVFREDFEDRYGFSDGLAWIMNPKTGRYYTINKRGNIEFKDVVAIEAHRFSEGLSAIRLMDDHGWAYLNKSGKVVIPPMQGIAHSFSDGLAPILIGDKYGYMDKQGKVVIKPQFIHAGDFSDGMANVMTRDESIHYIDKTGKSIWKWKKKVSPELMQAAEKGNTEAVKVLIEEKVDVNATDKNGMTALMWAAAKGHLATAELLITKGADINVSDNDGSTPLRYAAANDRTEIAKILIEKGVDMNAKDNKGVTPLKRAVEKGHSAMVELLRSYGAKE